MAFLPTGQSRKLILWNGPRASGKDTAAIRCVETFGAHHCKMSRPLKASIKEFFDLSDADVDYLESIKTEPTELLGGKSYVEVQISQSEDWAKPFFGIDIFGRLIVRRLRKAIETNPDQALFVCSDSGFVEEALPVVELFGKKNMLLVRLEREGKAFAGDSRGYISLPGVATCTLFNSDRTSYLQAVDDLVACFLAGDPCPF